jgi:hypothetical protein
MKRAAKRFLRRQTAMLSAIKGFIGNSRTIFSRVREGGTRPLGLERYNSLVVSVLVNEVIP